MMWCVVDEDERVVEGVHDVLDLAGGGLGPLAGFGALGLDALLLGLQDLFRDAAVVEELDELLLLAGEFAQSAGVALGVAAGDLGLALDVGAQRLADGVLLVWLERLALVAAYDGALGALDREVRRRAASAALDAAEAAEVLIDSAAFAAVAPVAEALAAGAEERALEVVVVLVGAVAAGRWASRTFWTRSKVAGSMSASWRPSRLTPLRVTIPM